MADTPTTIKRPPPTESPNEGQPPSKQTCENGLSSKPMDQNKQEHRGTEDCGNKLKPLVETTDDCSGGNEQIQTKANAFAVRQNPPLRPGPIQFTLIQPDSISLVWGPPKGLTSSQNFKLSWKGGGTEDSREVSGSNISIRNLLPGEKYEFTVVTLSEDNNPSECVSAITHTGVPAPEEISVKMNQNLVTWKKPKRLDHIEYVLSLWKESEREECLHTMTSPSEECSVPDVELHMAHFIRVSTVVKNGYQGKSAKYYIATAPEELTVVSVTVTSAELKWCPPKGTEHSYQISYCAGGTESKPIETNNCSTIIPDLKPCTNYKISVRTKLNDGRMSVPAETEVQTAVPAPEQLTVTSEMPTSAKLTWNPPQKMEKTPLCYQISYSCEGTEPTYSDLYRTISGKYEAEITGLQPCTDYSVSVCTKTKDGEMSEPVEEKVHTAVSAPDQIKIGQVTPTSVQLTWSFPQGMEQIPHSYLISYHSGGTQSVTSADCSTIIKGLKPYADYSVSVHTKVNDEEISEAVQVKVRTAVPAPEQLTVTSETPTSAKLMWSPPQGMEKTQLCYLISYSCEGTEPIYSDLYSTISGKYEAEITGLQPCTDYSVSVCTKTKDGEMSEPVKEKVHTAMPLAKNITGASVTPTSIHLTWSPPQGMDQTPHSYQISYNNGGPELEPICTEECRISIRGLKPCTHYNVTICVKLVGGKMCDPVKKIIRTAIPAPEQLRLESVTTTKAELTWSPPQGMEQTPYRYQITYHSTESKQSIILPDLQQNKAVITDLKPYTKYTVSITSKLQDGAMSEVIGKVFCTAVPVPENIKVSSVTPTSFTLKWHRPQGMKQTPLSYQISCIDGPEPKCTDKCEANITGLKPCSKYSVTIRTKIEEHKDMSEAVEKEVSTAVPVPEHFTVDSVTATSIHLTWIKPNVMGQTQHSYQISYYSEGLEPQTIPTESCSAEITDLQPDTKYKVSICTKFNDRESVLITKEVHTEILTRKLYTIVIGNTQNHHQPLKRRLANRNLTDVRDVESCDVILAFCVIVSRVGTDMEAALKQIPDSKPVVLTVMHHTFDPDHVTPDTSRFVRGRNITVVDILFHEDKGILKCQRNSEAEQKIQKIVWTCPESKRTMPLTGSSTRRNINPSPTKEAPASSHKETGAPKSASSDSVRNQLGTMTDSILGHIGLRESTKKSNSSSVASKEVAYCVVLTGNTLGSHKDFQKRLAERVVLPNEVNQSAKAQCSFLLVFCPVVSSVGVDVEKALKQIPDDKSSILVVMHHTFNPDFLPPESRGYSRSSNILIVDCLFYEDTGILKCQRNDEALDKSTKWIIEKFPNLIKSSQNMLTSTRGFRFW